MYVFLHNYRRMHKKTTYTVDEALRKLEHYCMYQDRCHKEVENKLDTMNMIPEAKEQIILHLLQHDFLNEERFAKSFARGKFRIKKWGKQRIIRELKYRGISKFNIESALKDIDDTDYLNTFHELAERKFKSLTDSNKLKKKKKLLDYLAYRGWENDLIIEKLNELFK